MAKTLALKVSGAAWGSEATMGSNDGLLYLSGAFPPGVPTPGRSPEIGVSSEREPQKGLIEENELGIVSQLRFENFDQVFALMLGADSVTNTEGGVYQHDHTYVDLPTEFGAAAWDGEEDGLHSWPGAYPVGFEISAEMGENVEITTTWMVAQQVIDGSVNTQAVMDSVGYHTQKHIVRLEDDDSYFRINTQSDGSLDANDEACIRSFNLSFQRNVRPIYCIGDGDETQEPVNEAFPDVSLNVTFAKRVDSALPETYGFLSPAQQGSAFKAEILLRGGTIDASNDFHVRFQFPALTITEGFSLDIDNPYVNELEVPFMVTGAESAPTGMTETDYLNVQTQNTVSDDYIS